MSCFLNRSHHASIASYRLGSSVGVVRYGRLGSLERLVRYDRVLREVKEVVATSRRNPDEFPFHSLRIEGATALAAGRKISERAEIATKEVDVRHV